jgi:hypothetical protein
MNTPIGGKRSMPTTATQLGKLPFGETWDCGASLKVLGLILGVRGWDGLTVDAVETFSVEPEYPYEKPG